MRPLLSDADLHALLAEDVPHGDLTTLSLGIAARPARMVFAARKAMRVAAVEDAVRLLQLAGAHVTPVARSGDALEAGGLILSAEGRADALHTGWKSAQNLLEWASGIATATAALVAAAHGRPVACTRKNVPGTKALSVGAVRAGGATLHRLGLSESLLIFAEHRLFLDHSPTETIAHLRDREPEKTPVVEVGTVDEALTWAHAGAPLLQLEKFPVEAVSRLREELDRAGLSTRLAAAGGIHPGNAGAYVAAGADLLVSSWPYTAPPADVQVDFLHA